MFRRAQHEPAESIDMLRTKNLARMTPVFTADGERIGVALRFVHRPIEQVNEALKLYRSFLIVQSIPLAGPVYIPTLFIEEYDPQKGEVTLMVDLATVQEEVWNREPDFVARGEGVFEELSG